jgi:hypothetical protein
MDPTPVPIVPEAGSRSNGYTPYCRSSGTRAHMKSRLNVRRALFFKPPRSFTRSVDLAGAQLHRDVRERREERRCVGMVERWPAADREQMHFD